MEVSLRMQKIIGHFMIFCQLQQVINFSNFGDFESFKFQSVIKEVYFMPSFLVKNKFQVEGHVWMQNIIGHFWRKFEIFLSIEVNFFPQLWLNATFSSSIHLIPFFFHLKAWTSSFQSIKNYALRPLELEMPWIWIW